MELTNKEIGMKIRELRESKNLSLREVANEIGIDYSHLGRVERGSEPSVKLLRKIADYFEVDITYFFGETTEVPEELKNVGVEWITFAKEMEERDLTPDEIKTVLKVLGKLNDSKS